MSVRVVAVITATEGSADQVVEALTRLAEGTRSEPGCRSYELFRSGSDGSAFVTVEEWDDQADLDAHMQGENIRQAFATVGDSLAGAPAIHPLVPLG